MTGPTHLIVGLTSAVYLGYSTPGELAVVGLASLIADIDRKQSLLGRFIPVLPTLIESILGKRTLTHSMLFGGGIALLLYLFLSPFMYPFLIGYLSHILLDLFTGNMALLFPFPKKYGIYLGIPPVFLEAGLLMGLGMFFAFNWQDFINRISFIPFGR